jgi:hypothetical protein
MSSQHEELDLSPQQPKLLKSKSSFTENKEAHQDKITQDYKHLVEQLQNARDPGLTEDLVNGID